MFEKVWLPAVALFCFAAGTGCETNVSPTVCTTEFVTVRVTVLDTVGVPVDSVNIMITNMWSGEIYDLAEENKPGSLTTKNGLYAIFHDGYRRRLQKTFEPLRVEGEKEGLQFSEVFVIGRDECHVFKMAGPDTVFLATPLSIQE